MSMDRRPSARGSARPTYGGKPVRSKRTFKANRRKTLVRRR